ncbi:hypothetical protein [Pedobacter sp.]|uniref:TapB family protein n=1 Tax=Pedobacter sp. TaxID=1411316 RepID=UPI00396C7553
MKREILSSKWILMLLILGLTANACKKDKSETTKLKEADKNSFVPRLNTRYIYSIIEDDVNIGTATKWIDGGKDSMGIQIYNLHTNIAAHGMDMALDNSLYVANGKTYTSFNMPDAWYALVAELKKTPNVVVEEAKTTGFPGYMVMENAIRENATLTWEIPGITGQYLRYVQKQSGSNTTFEVTQEIVQKPGNVVAVETITVPGGTFVCSKFVYTSSQQQIIKVDGKQMMSRDGTETITLWMAHGVGVVKQENATVFGGTTSSSTIVLNNIKS